MSKKELLERLKHRISAGGESECWHWSGSKDKKGYGQVSVNGKLKYVRRVLFELYERPIAEGKNLCNTCGDKLCINPAHMHIGMHTTFDWEALEAQLAEKAAMAGFDEIPTLETLRRPQ